MGVNSKIEWTHHTFNPWWGCVKVSPACDHCYAEAMAKRTGNAVWGKDAGRRFFGDGHWSGPLKWDQKAKAAGERHRVFCGSMCDVMEEYSGTEHLTAETMEESRQWLFRLIGETPNLDWLLLTKRPQNFRRFLPAAWLNDPRPNVWGMTTVESQEYMWRARELCNTPFHVRGISAEPLLGPLELTPLLSGWETTVQYPALTSGCDIGVHCEQRAGIAWVIVGGESGPGARPTNPEWVRSIRDQCVAAGAPFFFKQWGEYAPLTSTDGIAGSPFGGHAMMRLGKKSSGRLLDGREWNRVPGTK